MGSNDNKKVMSVAIKPQLHDKLKKFAVRKGLSVSAYVGSIIEQAIKLNPDEEPLIIGKPIDEEVLPVVLKIPANLKDDSQKLKAWLDFQVNGIYGALTKNAKKNESEEAN